VAILSFKIFLRKKIQKKMRSSRGKAPLRMTTKQAYHIILLWKIGKNLLILKNIDRISIHSMHYFDKRWGN